MKENRSKINPLILIGSIISVIAGLLLPFVYIYVYSSTYQITDMDHIPFILFVNFNLYHTGTGILPAGCPPYSLNALVIPHALFVVAGVLGLVGGSNQNKGLNVAASTLPFAGFASIFLVLNYYAMQLDGALVTCDISFYSLRPMFGTWIALAGGCISLLGLLMPFILARIKDSHVGG